MANIEIIKGVHCFIDKDGVAQLNLEDVSRGLGFTQVAKSGNLSIRWERVDKHLDGLGIPTSGDGARPSFIPEPIFYLLAMKAENEIAKVFQHTIAYEVLPTIRKHGAYMTPETIEQVLADPDTIIRLATDLKAEREQRKLLEHENIQQKQLITEYEPKVEYLDKILQSKNTITVKQIAADYDMSAQELNKVLYEEHVQYCVNGQWLLYREHQGMGYTKSKLVPITRASGTMDSVLHTQWTQKGRLFIHNLLKKRGIMAVIDRKLAGEQIAI